MEQQNSSPLSSGGSSGIMVAGSLLSAVALFALSLTVVMAIGFLLGALVLTERIARSCNSEESWDGEQVTPSTPKQLIGEIA